MAVNRDKLKTELAASGIGVLGMSDNGRMVLAGGSILPVEGEVWSHESGGTPDVPTLTLASGIRAAHDTALTVAQSGVDQQRRGGGVLGALASCICHGESAPEWARTLMSGVALKASEA